MKSRKITMLLTATCLSIALTWTLVRTAEAKEIGDVVGQVLATDIQAYVNGSPIPSMNVMGYTAVAVEDLRQYGFDVAWIPQQRRLVIHSCSGNQQEPIPVPQAKEAPGTKLADVLYTDIETFYEDTKISSYNIDGKTAVLLNVLEPFGQVVWSEKERKLSFTPAPTADSDRPVHSPLVLRQTDSITIDGIAFGDEGIKYEDDVVGRIVNDRPMMSVKWMAARFGYTMEKTDDGYYVKSGTYSFLLHPGENKIERFWFGSPAGEIDLFLAPVLGGDGNLLAYETDLKHLFGYYSVWDPETQKLNVDYRTYLVEDYGLPDHVNNYFYSIRLDEYVSGYAGIPSLLTNNRINGSTLVYGGSSGDGGFDADGNGPKYRMHSGVGLNFGHNDIETEIAEDLRILFYKSLSVDLMMKQVEPIIDYSRQSYSFGDYTVLKSVTPERAYNQTTSRSFEVTGVVSSRNGSGLTFTVEVQDGDQFRKISEQNVLFDQDLFNVRLTLPDDPGLYRITALSLVTNPRNMYTTAVAKWYVEKGKE